MHHAYKLIDLMLLCRREASEDGFLRKQLFMKQPPYFMTNQLALYLPMKGQLQNP